MSYIDKIEDVNTGESYDIRDRITTKEELTANRHAGAVADALLVKSMLGKVEYGSEALDTSSSNLGTGVLYFSYV